MNEKRKSMSPNIIQVKNWQKTITTEEKLDVICQLEKGEQTVDLCHYITVIHSSVSTIQDNADRIKRKS
jgi:hypothetical protein